MKKIKIISMILIVLVFVNAIPVHSVFTVTNGATFLFDTVESIWDFGYEDYKSSGSGFSLNDIHFTNNTLVTVEVDYVQPTYVDFTATVGSESYSDDNGHTQNSLFFSFFKQYPALFSGILKPWNQTRLDLGRPLITLFFIDYDNMNDNFKFLANDTELERIFDRSDYVINRVSGSYTIDSSIAVYNYLLDCIIIGEFGLDTYGGNFTYQVAYQINTDRVLGFEMYHNFSGYRDAEYYKLYHYYKAEALGFDLDELYYEVDVPPTIGFLPASIIIASTIGLGILEWKRKRKRL